MGQKNLSVMFIPAVAGLFFFMKRPKIEEVDEVCTEYPVYTSDPSGLTGVARYLNKQETTMLANNNSKILENKMPIHVVSGVARYLENKELNPTSGVTKYLLRQALAAKHNSQGNKEIELTGVDRYLKNRKQTPGLSGVAKYLKHQESLPKPSKVAKYMAKQAALASLHGKQTHKEETGVAKYMQRLESLPQPSRVTKYMAKQAALAAKQSKQPIAQLVATGVEKYIQLQASQPTISKVAKYMVRQALNEKQKPVTTETGVDRYMRQQI